MTETIAQALGAKADLGEQIGDRRLLLLLDNFEQVIDAVPDLSALLRSCPNLLVLVTSRELLRIGGEIEYAVPPLGEPEAVALFCERAQAEPSEEIRKLCARLDDLPLAVELAAARAKALSPGHILSRLSSRLDLLKGGRDAEPRQRTLRATMEWSYDLLSPSERQHFGRVAVFAGGFTLEAAEEVCDADLDALQSLVEKSLIQFGEARYWMLESVREFAAERLQESGERSSLTQRHAAYFLRLAESQALPGRYVTKTVAARQLALEMDNLRAALGSAFERGDLAFVARILAAMWSVLLASGYGSEGVLWSRRLVARRGDLSPEDLRRALHSGGELTRHMGLLEEAEPLKLELVELVRSTDRELAAATLADLADVALRRDDVARARSFAEEAVALGGGIRALASLAEVELREGDFDAATEHLEEVARGFEGVHDYNHAWAIEAQAETARRRGDHPQASALFADAALRFARLGDQASVGDCLDGLARLAQDGDDSERAGILAGAAERLRDEWGRPVLRPDRVPVGVPEAARARGRDMSFDAILDYATANAPRR